MSLAGFSPSTFAILQPAIKKLNNYCISGLKYTGSISSLTQSPISTNKGDLYISNVEGTLSNFGNISVKQGDGLIYNGSGWDKISYSELIKLQESFMVVDKYSSLSNSLSKDTVVYVKEDEGDNKSGFYVYDAVTRLWTIVSSNSSGSGGSGNLTTDLISNVTVGGVSANTKYTKGTSLETIIKDILVKYFPADLVFSLNPSKTLYKIGEVVNTIDMIANVTKKSNNIENIKYYIDGALVDTKDETTDTGIENGGTYTYTHGTPFSTDTTFKVDVYDGKNTTTKTIKVEFVNPFYCGLASSTLQEIVQKKGAYTYNNITCNNDSIIFKYPKSYGTLTSILDSNNFENISAFSRSEEVINSVDYYVYTSAVTTVTNFKFIFKF